MKNILAMSFFALAISAEAQAQVVSCATYTKAQPRADVRVPFRVTDEGVATPIEWGLDLAWLSEGNVRTGIAFAGKDLIDIMRVSFRPTTSVADGKLGSDQLEKLKKRADIVKKYCKENVSLNINDDHEAVDPWYNEAGLSTAKCGERWAKVIDLHIKKYAEQGLTNFVSISPFNEPDYGWDQGRKATRQADMKATVQSLRKDFDGAYDNVRMCGGNTLNDDCAYDWWNYMKDVLNEGNTHQLAGDFDHYADFFTTVRAFGHHATADELHNTMEAMVGVEYGMQTGIWWGTCEYTRSQFMKATYQGNPGRRLGYAEHRANWTSASVYRHADGTIQGFGGTSERQAKTTDYCFTSLDRPVWYAGERGREYVMHLNGGTGYQQGQTGDEILVDIQSDDDIMPHITEGAYCIMNLKSGRVMGFSSAPSQGWNSIKQQVYSKVNYRQWVVKPVKQEGDYCYYTLWLNTDKDLVADILNWNDGAGADVGTYPGGLGTNEQWFLQYAGKGSFYIRSRYSAKYLEVAGGSASTGANVQMGDFTGKDNQKWRFLPTDVKPNLVAPAAPANLIATPQGCSIKLEWEASADEDLKSYTVLRSEDGENFYTLAKDLTGTMFTDNETEENVQYTYAVYAEDLSLNQSERSNTQTACVTNAPEQTMLLTMDDVFTDATHNGNHAAQFGNPTFTDRQKHHAMRLNGTSNYLLLPPTVVNHRALTISCWMLWTGSSTGQRLWSFGNSDTECMYLTPSNGIGLTFSVKAEGQSLQLQAPKAASAWSHVVVTIDENGAVLYVNGEQKDASDAITSNLVGFRPACNYIGRAQNGKSLFSGYIDDFAIYNYALSAEEIRGLADDVEPVWAQQKRESPVYDIMGRKASSQQRGIVISQGKKILR